MGLSSVSRRGRERPRPSGEEAKSIHSEDRSLLPFPNTEYKKSLAREGLDLWEDDGSLLSRLLQLQPICPFEGHASPPALFPDSCLDLPFPAAGGEGFEGVSDRSEKGNVEGRGGILYSVLDGPFLLLMG